MKFVDVKLRPVIFIGILDFGYTQNPHYISRNQVRDIETGEQILKDLEFTFIELEKFNKEAYELRTLTDKWVYFIKNAENLEIFPTNINDEGLKSAYEEANIQTWTQEELDAYEYVFMREEDERARFDKATKIAEQKGKIEGKIEIVLEMFEDGLPLERISKIAKMPLEQVNSVLENRKR